MEDRSEWLSRARISGGCLNLWEAVNNKEFLGYRRDAVKAAVKINRGIAKAEIQEDASTVQSDHTIITFQARKCWSRETS